MSSTVSLRPLTRIEGHLSVHTETEPFNENNDARRVTEARCEGEMFRGFENVLVGRDPLDAQQITQRICGVCPISHGIASVRAQEMAYGITPNHNGRILQNLIFAANQLQSHVLHFYHLAALDFIDVKAILKYSGNDRTLKALQDWVTHAVSSNELFPVAPFLPQWEADYVENVDFNVGLLAHYVEALNIRRLCHEMGAVFGARLPHSTALIPGGCTQVPTEQGILAYSSRLKQIFSFIRDVYLSDLIQVAQGFPQYFKIGRGCGNYLCYGVFLMDSSGAKHIRPGAVIGNRWEPLDASAIREEVSCSRYQATAPLHPSRGETVPDPNKHGAYSWIKAPRYRGQVMEVGPLARLMVNYHDPDNTAVKQEVDVFLKKHDVALDQMKSVLGRHVARGLEAMRIARLAMQWIQELRLNEPPAEEFEIPKTAVGAGLTEAPRGALGHWLEIENHRIKRYQCVVPTTWNCSPHDDQGHPGAVEQALTGISIENPSQPIEIGRVVRSFDPCLACSIH
ncbi:MAG: nickel-dependent hydrogenase large subunit [Pirellulales bacterium]|nr:nickel-dependent hydrogenase large subunit [Pirellulales bacterium]